MQFDIKKYLVENKLTNLSSMEEDDNTGLVMPTGDNEQDFDVPDTDDWDTPEEDDIEDFEQEPTSTDVKQDEPSVSNLHKKQLALKGLEDQKDALLMQLKSNIISLDQYKEKIGNIPAQIKKLRADLEQAMDVSMDDDSEGESI